MRRIRLVLSALVLIAVAYFLGWSNFFPVKEITVGGEEKKISSEIINKVNESPAVIQVGEPLARVDKREITSRLRELLWVDRVKVSRNLISGTVTIDVSPRRPLAEVELEPKIKEANRGNEISFLGENLRLFSLPGAAVEKAAATGDVDWQNLPILRISNGAAQDEELLSDVKTLLAQLRNLGFAPVEVRATASNDLASLVRLTSNSNAKKVEIRWGSIADLNLKSEVVQRLLALKENKSIRYLDVTDPLTPSVR